MFVLFVLLSPEQQRLFTNGLEQEEKNVLGQSPGVRATVWRHPVKTIGVYSENATRFGPGTADWQLKSSCSRSAHYKSQKYVCTTATSTESTG